MEYTDMEYQNYTISVIRREFRNT